MIKQCKSFIAASWCVIFVLDKNLNVTRKPITDVNFLVQDSGFCRHQPKRITLSKGALLGYGKSDDYLTKTLLVIKTCM